MDNGSDPVKFREEPTCNPNMAQHISESVSGERVSQGFGVRAGREAN